MGPDAAIPVGLIKLHLELGAPIYLDHLEGERQPLHHSALALRAALTDVARATNLEHAPAGDHVAGGDMLEDHTRKGRTSSVSTFRGHPSWPLVV